MSPSGPPLTTYWMRALALGRSAKPCEMRTVSSRNSWDRYFISHHSPWMSGPAARAGRSLVAALDLLQPGRLGAAVAQPHRPLHHRDQALRALEAGEHERQREALPGGGLDPQHRPEGLLA